MKVTMDHPNFPKGQVFELRAGSEVIELENGKEVEVQVGAALSKALQKNKNVKTGGSSKGGDD